MTKRQDNRFAQPQAARRVVHMEVCNETKVQSPALSDQRG
jgi:hypothetical protein